MNEEIENKVTGKSMVKILEMVSYLKEKNIKFEEYTEADAEKYVKENNNYFNVTAYKKISQNTT